MREPLAPIVVNGVAFAVSSDEPAAVLYAIDATTGRELWTSGRIITSPARRPALGAGIGQVHVATSDDVVYASALRWSATEGLMDL
jgi:outer membrane protein assembly factor BamB